MMNSGKRHSAGKRVLSLTLAVLLLVGLLAVIPSKALAADRVPTEEEVYEAMMAMKTDYPEGTRYTDSEYYEWHGGYYSRGYGCAGFAFMLSDAAFGTLPVRFVYNISIKSVHVGDILRVNNNSHSVIVTEVHDDYVVLAEGNYNSSVHWGRTMTAAQVAKADFMLTRYPEGTFPDFYTVTYNANGGFDNVAPSNKEEGKDLEITKEVPFYPGNELLGWALSPDASEPDYLPGSLYKEDKSVVLYAVWKPTNSNTYEMVFHDYDVITYHDSTYDEDYSFAYLGYEFIPNRTALYSFVSSTDVLDPYIVIQKNTGEIIATADDIDFKNGNLNFLLECELTAGETYIVVFYLYVNGAVGSYTVTVDIRDLPVPGDVDGDGKVSLMDVSMLYKWWNGKLESTKLNLENADMDDSGNVDLRDAAALFRSL